MSPIIIWPDCSPPGAQPFKSISCRSVVAYIGASIFIPHEEATFNTHVGVCGSHHGVARQPSLAFHLICQNIYKLVAVNDISFFVAGYHPVAVSVKGKAYVESAAFNFFA